MSLSGKIQTVRGLIDPQEIGVTLPHEHLSMNFNCVHMPLDGAEEENLMDIPFKMENLGWIRQHPYSHKLNLKLNDPESNSAILEEMGLYKINGGDCIVENTTTGIERDIRFLKMVSEQTDVKVVAGTGFYIAGSQTPETLLLKQEPVTQHMIRELTEGCEDTGIKCGIVGEIACSWPIHGFEKTCLRASADVQNQLGCPVMIHPGRNSRAPYETMRYFLEAGGDASKTVMAHLDRTVFERDEMLEFTSLGSICEFDLFGNETSHYQINPDVDMSSDAQRIAMIKYLIEEGIEDRIFISHDHHSKHRLTKFGGHGFSHILVNVVPKMLTRGITKDQIHKFLVDNPRKWLTFR